MDRRDWIICAVLVVATLAVYAQVTQHHFVGWDDNVYVYENPQVRNGLTGEGILWALTAKEASNWHPVTWWSHMLDVQWAGVEEGAGRHHLTSAAIHALNACLLFVAVRRLTEPRDKQAGDVTLSRTENHRAKRKAQQRTDSRASAAPRRSPSGTARFWAATWVAGVFALHPLHVESVAWVAERKDVLAGFFGLLVLVVYAEYARRPFVWWRYGLVCVLLTLGLMSKPMLVTWPFVLLLLDIWPLGRWQKALQQWRERGPWRTRVLVEKLPLLGIVATSSVVTFLVQRAGGAVRTFDTAPLGARLVNVLLAYGAYVRQSFWPTGLAFFYPLRQPSQSDIVLAVAIGVLLVVLSGMAVAQLKRRPYLAVGWFWFLGTLVPVIGLVQVGGQARADRYMYLPQIGLTLAVAWMAMDIARSTAARQIVAVLAMATLLVCSLISWQQVGVWESNRTLAEAALRVDEENHMAHYLLGVSHNKAGDAEAAIQSYRRAIELNRKHINAAHDLAVLLYRAGESDEAFQWFAYTTADDPDFAKGFSGLAAVELQRNRAEAALQYAQRAAELAPDDFGVQVNLARVLEKLGRCEAAWEQYGRAIALPPNTPDPQRDLAAAHRQRGHAALQLGRTDAAAASYEDCLSLTPDDAAAHAGLATIARDEGDIADSIEHYRRALAADPQMIGAANDLAWLMATTSDERSRDPQAALAVIEPLCQSPDTPPELLDTLAAAYAGVERWEEAVATARRALYMAEDAKREELAVEIRGHIERFLKKQALVLP